MTVLNDSSVGAMAHAGDAAGVGPAGLGLLPNTQSMTIDYNKLTNVETDTLTALLSTLSNEHHKMKVYRELELRKNRHGLVKEISEAERQKKLDEVSHWLGSEYIKYKPTVTPPEKSPVYIKGDISQVRVIDSQTLEYIDHVSRIHTAINLGPATYTKPKLSPTSVVFDIPTEAGLVKKATEQTLTEVPEPYSYSRMENEQLMLNNLPVEIGLPAEFDREGFVFNGNAEVSECVLHLPVKLPRAKCQELNGQGRITNDGEEFSERKCYLPIELKSLEPFIKYAMEKEVLYNPYFEDQYYLFVSVSHSYVQPSEMQRRGGWHVDGHQGYERIQGSGIKLPTDRQYTMSNALPTEYVIHTFCFDKLRDYLARESCSMDSVNFQHVLEEHVNREISQLGREAVVKAAKPNTLTFFNPYIVHKAAVNTSEKPVLRTFLRLLFSVYPRDRLGDSMNPVFGPIFPMKIKVITDVHEPDVSLI